MKTKKSWTPAPLPPGWTEEQNALRAQRKAEADALRPGMEAAREDFQRGEQLTVPGTGPVTTMSPSEPKRVRRKPGPGPRAAGDLKATNGKLRVYIRFGPSLLREIDAYVSKRKRLDRAKVVRRAVRAWLDSRKAAAQ